MFIDKNEIYLYYRTCQLFAAKFKSLGENKYILFQKKI